MAGCGGDDGDTATPATTTTSRASTSQEPADGTTTTTTTTTDEPADQVRVVRLAFAGGDVTPGGERVSVGAGERLRLEVTSDVAEEVHVHGYDLEKEVPAGGTARFAFRADIEGIFEVELHGQGLEVAQLRVEP